MRRIFWDSMLLIYLLEGNPTYSKRVQDLLKSAYEREDRLFTSYLGLAEVMAGAAKSASPFTGDEIKAKLNDAGFSYLPFGEAAVNPFARLRSISKVKSADAMNLACAASGQMDLFLTGDQQLIKLHVPGIQFIADFQTPLL